MIRFTVPGHWSQRPSPNHSPRSAPITAIVLHADAASNTAGTLDWIRRAESKVSYHVVVDRVGDIYAVVNPDRQAWHAGASALDGELHCNRFSVGVCLANRNDGVEPYPLAQRSAAADVCALLVAHYRIPLSRIVTHAQVATPKGRKTDPRGLDLATFRDMVAARLQGGPMASEAA